MFSCTFIDFFHISHFQSFKKKIDYKHENKPIIIFIHQIYGLIFSDVSLIKFFSCSHIGQHRSLLTLIFSLILFPQTSYLSMFRQVYTVGYATSLISLITAIVVFTAFR